MTIEFKEGTLVKIVAPEGFDLDEFSSENEWDDISYIPDHMKQFIGNTGKITSFNTADRVVHVCGWNWPISWVVPLNSKKTKPKPSGKDFLGNVIHEGDQVVYARSGYRCFQLGTVQKITPTGARIVTGKNPYSGEPLTFFQTFGQIVKKP